MDEPDISRSYTGLIFLAVTCLALLFGIYYGALEDNCNVVSRQGGWSCIIWIPKWYGCLFTTLLILPIYAFFQNLQGKKTNQEVELNTED